MNDYMCAIIYGNTDEKRKDLDGNIEFFGDVNSNSLHIVNLLNFAEKKFPDIPIFKKLNIHHPPCTVSFFFTELRHAIFLNTSIDNKKMGMLYLPNNISEKQKKSLCSFMEEIENFTLYILYDLKMIDGLPDGEQLQALNEDDKPIDILNSYFELKENKNKAR